MAPRWRVSVGKLRCSWVGSARNIRRVDAMRTGDGSTVRHQPMRAWAGPGIRAPPPRIKPRGPPRGRPTGRRGYPTREGHTP